MDRITYDYYRIFYYVAKYKSISLAAQILHSNQPNITKFMNRLEEQLGCRLMTRSNKGIALTPEGERLFSHVAVAYSQLKEAEEELIGVNRLDTGSVRISATETALHGILMDELVHFRNHFPAIRLFITNESTPEAFQTLKKGLADFAVVTSPLDVPSGFQKTSLRSFHEILVASADSPFSKKTVISPVDLLSYPVIGLGHHSKTYEFYSHLLLAYGVEWKPDIEVATADQILPMIKSGLGIGFLPEYMANHDLEQGTIVKMKVSNLQPKREIILLEDKTKILNAAAKELKKQILATNLRY